MYAYDVPLKDAPVWLNALIAGEEWGCPPWEVLPDFANRRWWLMARNLVAKKKAEAYEYRRNKK